MAPESVDCVGEKGFVIIGGSVSVGAPVSDTLTLTVGSGIVVVVDWEIIRGGKEVVEIGMK